MLQPDEEQQPQWSDLPAECRREVLLRLSDPRDIEASSEACEHLAVLAQEQRIWRELAQYHFSPQQIATARQNNPEKDWKTIFTIARRYVLKKKKKKDYTILNHELESLYNQEHVLHSKVFRTARGVRGNDSAMPKLPLSILAIARPPVHRRSGSGLPGEARRRRSSLPTRSDSSPDLPQVFLAVNGEYATTCRIYNNT